MQQIAEPGQAFSVLSEIDLTRSLSEDLRRSLVEHCRFIECSAKHRIKLTELHPDRLFLLDGHIARLENGVIERLQAFRGLSEPIDLIGETLAPDACLVTETPCLFLRIPATALESIIPTRMEVSDIELDPAESEFLTELYHLINQNKLVLPARPEVALKIQEMTSDPETGIDALTEIIQRDPTIAGALLHATNSPLFRAAKEIKTIREAVLRLGFRNTRMLAVNLALRQAFRAKSETTRQVMEEVWNDSVLCSAHSYVIAEICRRLDRERALLAGLIAGVGAVPIIQFIENRAPDKGLPMIRSLIGKLANITGVLVINYWGLGDDLVNVAEHYGDWGYHAAEPDYTSIALIARWSALREEGREVPDASTMPAFKLLGLTPPPPGEPIPELVGNERQLNQLKSMFSL
ncbi:HDOD domain-containing protein [Caldichromatium japonicum]|uniref:HDOD domain-containing protein n=1 Tax=Caldichromatium japonicum TaxID=2699430 RepID=A0A6G7VAU1_9GAMM|nr:HDOD domain-containing protein [Caldichromatium japonicum]QIK36986.1 HDOD domain-containing protein [Caldichromatium japonicum]